MATEKLEELIAREYIHARNNEIHASRLAKRLEDKLLWAVFDSCCSVVKQVRAGIPDERIRENLKMKIENH